MRTLTILPSTRALLEARAIGGLRYVRPRPDGNFDIEVDEEVFEALERVDPNPDTAIFRLCTTGVGRA